MFMLASADFTCLTYLIVLNRHMIILKLNQDIDNKDPNAFPNQGKILTVPCYVVEKVTPLDRFGFGTYSLSLLTSEAQSHSFCVGFQANELGSTRIDQTLGDWWSAIEKVCSYCHFLINRMLT